MIYPTTKFGKYKMSQEFLNH